MNAAVHFAFYQAVHDAMVAVGTPEEQINRGIKAIKCGDGAVLSAAQHTAAVETIKRTLNSLPDQPPHYPAGYGGWDIVEGGYVSVVYKHMPNGQFLWREVDEA